MTLGNIFGSAMSSTSSAHYNQYPSSGDTQRIISDRDGTGYSYPFTKKSKGKYKSDKKHAAMSALTLLAFLFFLNILQNCLREQTQPFIPEVTMMMMMPAPQKHTQSDGATENERGSKESEKPWNGNIRKARSLLQFDEDRHGTSTKPIRHTKFIHDLRNINHNWANGLSQLSEKELENQRLKTDNLRSYLSRYTTSSEEKRSNVTPSPIIREDDKVVRETTTSAVPVYEAFKTVRLNKYGNLQRKQSSDDDWIPKVGPVYRPIEKIHNGTSGNNSTKSHERLTKRLISKIGRLETIETRNSRSDVTSVTDQPEDNTEVQTVTPSVDLNAYKTYPVYSYYNHRQTANPFRENRTEIPATTESTPEVNRLASAPPPTTEHYSSYPVKSPHHRYSQKNRFRYANHNRYYQPRYPIESRYKYSPYRKTSNYYEPAQGYHVHEEYYPVAVVRNPQEEESGFDLFKFVWTILAGFARPLSRIVPGYAKVGDDEPQCYDLLVCEAHRVSKFMGPTAEVLASTFSTLLTWYTAEENRQPLIEAVNSGKENTCQQQILDCDERSGGKSAMTVLAQVLEMKLR